MKRLKHLGTETLYFAGQWAEAGVYRCLDPCPREDKIVILFEDGILPDPTHGWVARFLKLRGREQQRFAVKWPSKH